MLICRRFQAPPAGNIPVICGQNSGQHSKFFLIIFYTFKFRMKLFFQCTSTSATAPPTPPRWPSPSRARPPWGSGTSRSRRSSAQTQEGKFQASFFLNVHMKTVKFPERLRFFLQQSMNGSVPSPFRPPDLKCRLNEEQEVNCSSQIYTSRSDWRHSRAFINEQIRRLRAQLYELKVGCFMQ